MIPILYKANATDFTKAGLGQLSRVINCKVTEGLNGTFELNMDLLRDDPLFNAIDVGAIIVAKPNQTQGNQPFVIEQINKSIDGLINIYATHIGQYRAKLIPIKPFNATSLADTLNKINTYSAETNVFTFYTDKTVSSAFSIKSPRSLRELLGGKEGSILDVYGGELFFDNYNVYLFTRRGRKSETINIMYGDNMTDYTQTDVFSWSKSITGALPYYYKKDNTSETYVEGDIQYSDYVDYFTYHKTIPVDFTDKFANETPTKAKLNQLGIDYVKKSGMPQVSINASFEDITTLPLYNPIRREIDVLQLGDYVNVINNEYNVNITTRIRELEYDVLLERYSTINIGDATETINDVISDTASSVTNNYGAEYVGGSGITIDDNVINNVFANMSDIDLNNITYNYQGYVSRVTNQPSGKNANGYLVVIANDSIERCLQYYKSYNGNQIYYRHLINGSWSDWRELCGCYEAGDTYSKNYIQKHCAGHTTGGGAALNFTIPMDRPINANSISFTSMTLFVYANATRLINGIDVISNSNYSVSALITNDKSAITVTVTPTTAFGQGLSACDVVLAACSGTFS